MSGIKIMSTIDSSLNIKADQKADIMALAETISDVSLSAMDLRNPPDVRGTLSALAYRLNDDLVALSRRFFVSGLDELEAANKKIKEANAMAKKSLADIAKCAATIAVLGQLVTALTELLRIAGLLL
jgi:hypothetical protein